MKFSDSIFGRKMFTVSNHAWNLSFISLVLLPDLGEKSDIKGRLRVPPRSRVIFNGSSRVVTICGWFTIKGRSRLPRQSGVISNGSSWLSERLVTLGGWLNLTSGSL